MPDAAHVGYLSAGLDVRIACGHRHVDARIVMAMTRYSIRITRTAAMCCAAVLAVSLLLVALRTSAARAQGGVAMVTGYNGYDELGDGGATGGGGRFWPELVPGLSNVVSASTSYYDTLALLSNGTVEGWGYNGFGELGDGTTEEQSTPVQIPGLSEVTEIAGGFHHGLALLLTGTVEAWGENEHGQLGDGATEERPTLTPTPVPDLSNAVAISAGCFDSFALLANGTVEAWGANGNGQLGGGPTNKPHKLPEQIPGLENVVAISAGCEYTIALLADGTVEAWGCNRYHERGDGELGGKCTAEQLTPAPIPGLSNVVAISTGADFGLALLDNGTVEGWGYDEHGELGDGGPKEQFAPEPIPDLSEVVAISAGADFGLALLDNGTVEGWGNNLYGELGDLTSSERLFSEELAFPNVAIGLAHGVLSYDTLVIEGARASVSSTALAFGTEVVDAQSPTQTLVVTNAGPAPLTISGDSLSGPGASAFAELSDACQGATLPPAGACAIEYAFAPSAVGGASATVAISSSATPALRSVALTGSGTSIGAGLARGAADGAPSLSRLVLSSSRFRAAHDGASVLPATNSRGTLVSYSDSQAAITTFAVQRELSGVRVRTGKSKSCASSRRRRRPRGRRLESCLYFRTLGSFTHADARGANRLRFSGRIAGIALSPGRYRLIATARSSAGASAARSVAFTIKR